MRKSLILTRNFPPLATGDASRVWKIASNLATIGWDPVVVAPPAVAGAELSLSSGASKVTAVHRTGPGIDGSKLEPAEMNALLHGKPLPVVRSITSRFTGLFRDGHDGDAWKQGAALQVAKLLEENPEIDMLYAQGPPVEPLLLALETARKHNLAVVLDITAPLDPDMPGPGPASSSPAARAEGEILLSGVPMITTTRALKEYFLKKYIGRLDHGAMTIVPNAFDSTHPAFGADVPSARNGAMRIALYIGDLPKPDLKAFIEGLDSWVGSDRVGDGDVEITMFGDGAADMAQRVRKSPAGQLLAFDLGGGIGRQLELCRNADLCGAVLGRTPSGARILPDRLVDALGMGRPLMGSLPEGVAANLVQEAGGATAQAGDHRATAALFRSQLAAWRSGTLAVPPAGLISRYAITGAMQELTRAIAPQYVF